MYRNSVNFWLKYTIKRHFKTQNVVFITISVFFMEKVCSIICVALGTIFMVMALLVTWRYLVTVGICYATAFLITEEKEH